MYTTNISNRHSEALPGGVEQRRRIEAAAGDAALQRRAQDLCR